jgi:hypothetical protein
MFEEAGAWFWTHVVAALLIIWSDSNGTLEPALNKFEERLGIRTELPPEEEAPPPYYMEEEPIDSTFILPPHLQINKDTTSVDIPPIEII